MSSHIVNEESAFCLHSVLPLRGESTSHGIFKELSLAMLVVCDKGLTKAGDGF